MIIRVSSLLPVVALVFSMAVSAENAPAAAGSTDAEKRTLALSATGTVNVRPDTAHITVGVVSEAENARTALDENNQSMTNIVDALKEKGIASRDIETTSFAVHPRYQHFKDGKPSVVAGYRVVNSVRITVRDIARLGEILDKVVSFGSNQIGGISFSVSETDALMDKARKRAIAAARERAQLYADAAGTGIGKVLKIEEVNTDSGPEPRFRAMATKSEAEVPIESGEAEISVRVNVVWALVDKG